MKLWKVRESIKNRTTRLVNQYTQLSLNDAAEMLREIALEIEGCTQDTDGRYQVNYDLRFNDEKLCLEQRCSTEERAWHVAETLADHPDVTLVSKPFDRFDPEDRGQTVDDALYVQEPGGEAA